MSEQEQQEQQQDIVIGKDGQQGYLNAEQRETLKEVRPDLAPYASLKFKTTHPDDEPADEERAHRTTNRKLKEAGEEIQRLQVERDDHRISSGVEQILDNIDQIAEDLPWEHQEEYRQAWQAQALEHAAAITDEDLRQRTFQKLEGRVDPDLYDQYVTDWQLRWVRQEEEDLETGLERAQREAEQQARTFDAVIELEGRLLAQLNPVAHGYALQLIEDDSQEIASMAPGAAQEAIRTRVEFAREMAQRVEAADTLTAIVHAHGKTKAGIDGRRLRDLTAVDLGLLDTNVTGEHMLAAHQRALRGVEVDRQKAKRQHKGGNGKGMTKMEKLMETQFALAKRLGIPVHDGQTGKRIV